jgi:hypothetical protein
VAAEVTPLTEMIVMELTANEAGTLMLTQVISSPPPLPPTF